MRSAEDLNVPKDRVLSIKSFLTWSHRQNSKGQWQEESGSDCEREVHLSVCNHFHTWIGHLSRPSENLRDVMEERTFSACGLTLPWWAQKLSQNERSHNTVLFQVSSCITLTNSIFKDSTDLHKTAVYCLPTKTPTSSYGRDKTTSEYAEIATPTIKLVLSEFYW